MRLPGRQHWHDANHVKRPSRFETTRLWAVAFLIYCISAATAGAQPLEILYLQNGDRMTGVSRGPLGGELRWQLPFGDEILIPLDQIDRIEIPVDENLPPDSPFYDGATPQQTAELDLRPLIEPPAALVGTAVEAVEPAYAYTIDQLTDWTKRVEIGGRFLDGNRDQDFLDFTAKFENTLDWAFSSWDAGGQFGQTDGDRTVNRWFGNGTIDFARESSWIVFVSSKNEYDEFENLAYRGTLSGGFGYRFYNEKRKRLIFRAGPGVTHELFNDPARRRTTPDLFLESEMRWPVHNRVQVEHKATVNPTVTDIEIYRVVSNSGLLLQLDNDERWMLKLGLRFEYNSKPNPGRVPSDYTSSILLVYTRK